MRKLFLALTMLTAALPAAAADPHPFNVRDLVTMQRITDPQPSPQGDRIAFVLRSTDLDANRGRTDLWMVNADGGGLTRLTSDPAADDNPRWAPDGQSLDFLSARSGSNQVWRLPLGSGSSGSSGAMGATGDPVQVTRLPLDVANLAVSPDGSRLAFSLEVYPDCPTLACTQERLDPKTKGKASGQLYQGDAGFFRHWDTWSQGLRNHLFTLPVSGEGEPADLTRGMNADSPSRPYGGTEEFTFSPDGRTVVFSARDAGREEPWSTNFDLYSAPADGSAAPLNLTKANLAWDTQPAFSPDGKTLAYLAMSRPGFEADRFHIRLRDLATGRERVLADAWDRSAEGLVFSRDGRTLYTTTPDVGQHPLFAIDVATGKVTKLVAAGHVHDPKPAGDRLVYGLDTLTSPVELFTVRPDGSGASQITHVNQEALAAVRMGESEQFSFQGANGDTVWGWITRPVGFQEGKKYPLAFLIHGGPQGSFSNEFHYRWNPQPYAGAGYAVVTVDFHGSTGYGQAFTDAIRMDWGGKPFVDLQKGLAAALQRSPWIDGDRACALGASYGGFMINWIQGNWPGRFKCLVDHDGTFDQRMMYYSTEELWFPEWEMGGPYWQSAAVYEKSNPVNFVERWKTPMLVVHGGLDYRIPVTQGIAAFNTLQRKGIPSQFLYFPDENHWVLKPANSMLWHDTVLAWLGRWLQPVTAK